MKSLAFIHGGKYVNLDGLRLDLIVNGFAPKICINSGCGKQVEAGSMFCPDCREKYGKLEFEVKKIIAEQRNIRESLLSGIIFRRCKPEQSTIPFRVGVINFPEDTSKVVFVQDVGVFDIDLILNLIKRFHREQPAVYDSFIPTFGRKVKRIL